MPRDRGGAPGALSPAGRRIAAAGAGCCIPPDLGPGQAQAPWTWAQPPWRKRYSCGAQPTLGLEHAGRALQIPGVVRRYRVGWVGLGDTAGPRQ